MLLPPDCAFAVPRRPSTILVQALCCAVAGWVLAAGCSGTTPPNANQAQGGWVVTEDGAGRVRLGMSRNELTTRGGAITSESEACEYVTPQDAPPGLRAMVVNGIVRRIDVSAAGVTTATGVEVGTSEARVRTVYPDSVIQPHKYTSGHYIVADLAPSATGARRLVFETDGRVVTRYRVGLAPEVDWVEGCG